MRIDSLTPITHASVQVGTLARHIPVAGDGTFSVRLDPASEIVIAVRAIGFMPARAVVQVPADSAVALVAALEGRPVEFDTCGGVELVPTP